MGVPIARSSVMSKQNPDMTPDERERFEREVIHHEPPNAPPGPASETAVAPIPTGPTPSVGETPPR